MKAYHKIDEQAKQRLIKERFHIDTLLLFSRLRDNKGNNDWRYL